MFHNELEPVLSVMVVTFLFNFEETILNIWMSGYVRDQ
jgi:hypothetical protein